MVMGATLLGMSPGMLLAAEDAAEPVLERLDPPRRAAVVMALLALTLIGLFLVVLIMVGGHWVRRLARHRPARGLSWGVSAADNSQLRQSLESVLPEAKTDDTVQFTRASTDTKVGN
jgi:ferric-dicitrate binding protein FerR (iron transport regulator)